MNKIEIVEQPFLRKELPPFRVGETIRVTVKIVEDEKVRLQAFEGIVIRKRGRGMGATFTVRRMSSGEGIERTFPLHSQSIQEITVLKTGKVRRARLYYLREKVGRRGRIEAQWAGDIRPDQTEPGGTTTPEVGPPPSPPGSA